MSRFGAEDLRGFTAVIRVVAGSCVAEYYAATTRRGHSVLYVYVSNWSADGIEARWYRRSPRGQQKEIRPCDSNYLHKRRADLIVARYCDQGGPMRDSYPTRGIFVGPGVEVSKLGPLVDFSEVYECQSSAAGETGIPAQQLVHDRVNSYWWLREQLSAKRILYIGRSAILDNMRAEFCNQIRSRRALAASVVIDTVCALCPANRGSLTDALRGAASVFTTAERAFIAPADEWQRLIEHAIAARKNAARGGS